MDLVYYDKWLYVVKDDEVIWSSNEEVIDFSIEDEVNGGKLLYIIKEENSYYLKAFSYENKELKEAFDKIKLGHETTQIEVEDFDNDKLSEVILLQNEGDKQVIIVLGGKDYEEIFRSSKREISDIWISREMIYSR